MAKFQYQAEFELGRDTTVYKKIGDFSGSVQRVGDASSGNQDFLFINSMDLKKLAEEAFIDVSHYLRTAHLEKLSKILKDPEASNNDRFVALDLLKNAVIAAELEFPSCQDTGTAIVMGKKGERVITGVDDRVALSEGIFEAYRKKNLRYSQMAPLSFFSEVNTGTNLPAQIDIYSEYGDEYHFLFIAKGGGSANKSYLFQKNKSLLNPPAFEKFVKEALGNLGTAACPPYHLALVIGGTSAEDNLKTVKLASCGYLDHLPTTGNELGRAFRDLELEALVEQWCRETRIGAQFGGKYLAHDVRVIRRSRHGASCPVGLGLSCSADRNIKGKITREGIFLEALEVHPARFLPAEGKSSTSHSQRTEQTKGQASDLATDQELDQTSDIVIDLRQPIEQTLKTLSGLRVSARVMLNGPMIVARDIAHAKIKELLDNGKPLPDYFKNFAIYYAGPAKTPKGYASGSFGPTTSERMDPYVPLFQSLGGSKLMLGKGNRTSEVTASCQKYGGFYLGSIGGPAARLGKECITRVEVLAYPELGMEAIYKIEVKDFPAFVIVDDKGNDFFRSIRTA